MGYFYKSALWYHNLRLRRQRISAPLHKQSLAVTPPLPNFEILPFFHFTLMTMAITSTVPGGCSSVYKKQLKIVAPNLQKSFALEIVHLVWHRAKSECRCDNNDVALY